MTKSKPKKPSRGDLSPAQIDAANAARDSAGARTPKAVLAAFIPDPIKVGELTIQPITLGVFLVLEKLGSPLVDPARAGQLSSLDVARAVYVLSRPPADVRREIGEGLAAFDERVNDFCDRIPVSELASLGEKVAAHFTAAFATIIGPSGSDVGRVPPRGADHGKEQGTDPLAPSPAPATASAGS